MHQCLKSVRLRGGVQQVGRHRLRADAPRVTPLSELPQKALVANTRCVQQRQWPCNSRVAQEGMHLLRVTHIAGEHHELVSCRGERPQLLVQALTVAHHATAPRR